MKRFSTLMFLVSQMFFLTGCDKYPFLWPHDRPFTHYYQETKCADPWRPGEDDQALKEHVIAYLAEHDITVQRIALIHQDPPESCEACVCKTGRRIWVQVPEADEEKMLQLSEVPFQQWIPFR